MYDEFMNQFYRSAYHIQVSHDPNETLEYWMPHYSNPYFNEAQTIYVAEGFKLDKAESFPGLDYEYSDRLYSWFTEEKLDTADRQAAQFPRHSAAWAEAWLRAVYDKPDLKVVHIMAGVNWSSGHPYQVFGFIVPKED